MLIGANLHEQTAATHRSFVQHALDADTTRSAAADHDEVHTHLAATPQEKALIQAVESQQAQQVKAQLEQGVPADIHGANGWNLLQLTLHVRRSDIFKEVFKYYSDVNSRSVDGSTTLAVAAQKSMPEAVDLLLRHGADPNVKSHDLTPLLQANDDATAQLLLRHKADPNTTAPNRLSPLMSAVNFGKFANAKLLLDWGADPNIPFHNGKTPIWRAVEKDDSRMVDLLLEHEADVNAEDDNHIAPLDLSVLHQHTQITNKLLEKGADPGRIQKLKTKMMPIQIAVSKKNLALTKTLLDKGASPNILTPQHQTPLHTAAHETDVRLADELLKHRAFPDATDHHGLTAMHIAAEESNPKMVRTLIHYGAKPDMVTQLGSPLLIAVLHNDIDTATILLDGHADIDHVYDDRMTVLMGAIYHKNVALAKLLLSRGASPNVHGKDRLPPMLMALQNRQPDLVEDLLKHGGDPNAKAMLGFTQTMSTVYLGSVTDLQMLFKYGANPNILNDQKASALGIASMMDKKEMVIELLRNGARYQFPEEELPTHSDFPTPPADAMHATAICLTLLRSAAQHMGNDEQRLSILADASRCMRQVPVHERALIADGINQLAVLDQTSTGAEEQERLANARKLLDARISSRLTSIYAAPQRSSLSEAFEMIHAEEVSQTPGQPEFESYFESMLQRVVGAVQRK